MLLTTQICRTIGEPLGDQSWEEKGLDSGTSLFLHGMEGPSPDRDCPEALSHGGSALPDWTKYWAGENG